MYKNNKYRFEIDIRLDNGIYEFSSIESQGKTLLCKELKNLAMLGENVLSFTLSDVKSEIDIEGKIERYRPQVLMFDRYDMYYGKYDRIMEKIKDETIILVDCKTGLNIDGSDICLIRLSKGKISVID